MNLFVLSPASKSEIFITSDNPGFTLVGDNIFNTHLKEFNGIAFPLNSRQLLFLTGKSAHSDLIINKDVHYAHISSKLAEQLNTATLKIADEFIYCEDKQYIKKFLHKGLQSLE
jgi:hypothetical protein